MVGFHEAPVPRILKGGTMKCALAVLALFAVSTTARADSVSSPFGPLYYPDGATVTSVSETNVLTQQEAWTLDYSFADGTGDAIAPGLDGEGGGIQFSTPITSITFSYVWTDDDGYPFDVIFSGGQTFSSTSASGTQTIDFDENVTGLRWIGGLEDEGTGGITSLSYALDGPPVATPEPGELLLSAFGLAAIFGLALTRRR